MTIFRNGDMICINAEEFENYSRQLVADTVEATLEKARKDLDLLADDDELIDAPEAAAMAKLKVEHFAREFKKLQKAGYPLTFTRSVPNKYPRKCIKLFNELRANKGRGGGRAGRRPVKVN